MIKTFLVRGDLHGDVDKLINQLVTNNYERETTAVIILGDFGINFWLNKTDQKKKEFIEAQKYYIYAVRGNHEMRPQHLENIETIWDDEVGGNVYVEPQYPHIRYFMDYGVYTINNYKCAVVGGAYSVDKWWRLERAGMTEETNDPKKTGWFADECLTSEEMADAEKIFAEHGPYFDFLFCHTCPIIFQPTDLFLGAVDQSKVDKGMEVWLDKIYKQFIFGVTLFGHYHADRIEAPFVEQYFNDIEELNVIKDRWDKYTKTGQLDWWLHKSPSFYMNKEETNAIN